MINTSVTFVQAVFTLYTFYRYVFQRNDHFRDLFWAYFEWEFFYLASMLIIVYTTSSLTAEVNII